MRELLVDKMSWEDYKTYRRCWRNIRRYRKSKNSHPTGIEENRRLANIIVDKYLRKLEEERKKFKGD